MKQSFENVPDKSNWKDIKNNKYESNGKNYIFGTF